MDDLEFRYSEPGDERHLLRWLENDEINKWHPPTGKREISSFIANWIGFSRFNSSLTALLNNEVCAIGTLFLMTYQKVAHQCMLNMIVDPAFTGRGIEDSLLKNMINLAKNYFKLEMIIAEMFEGFNFIKVLEKYDFKIFARQENFVKEGDRYLCKILYQLFL